MICIKTWALLLFGKRHDWCVIWQDTWLMCYLARHILDLLFSNTHDDVYMQVIKWLLFNKASWTTSNVLNLNNCLHETYYCFRCRFMRTWHTNCRWRFLQHTLLKQSRLSLRLRATIQTWTLMEIYAWTFWRRSGQPYMMSGRCYCQYKVYLEVCLHSVLTVRII